MSAIADNLQAVQARIREATKRAGRSPESVRLLAVSKTWPLSSVMAAVDAGVSAYIVDGLTRSRIKPVLDLAVQLAHPVDAARQV